MGFLLLVTKENMLWGFCYLSQRKICYGVFVTCHRGLHPWGLIKENMLWDFCYLSSRIAPLGTYKGKYVMGVIGVMGLDIKRYMDFGIYNEYEDSIKVFALLFFDL